MFDTKKLALFLGGVVFGSAGFKVLSSKDAKKVYTQTTQKQCKLFCIKHIYPSFLCFLSERPSP